MDDFFKSVASVRSVQRTHGRLAALHNVKHNHVLDENCHGFQYEGHKQVHVDVVSCAVQLPVKQATKKKADIDLNDFGRSNMHKFS